MFQIYSLCYQILQSSKSIATNNVLKKVFYYFLSILNFWKMYTVLSLDDDKCIYNYFFTFSKQNNCIQSNMTDQKVPRSESEIDKQRQSACPTRNTFRLQPEKNTVFSSMKVTPTLENVLAANLTDYKYTSDTSGELCKKLADECKQRLKSLGFSRYKLVTQCLMFSNNNQSVRFASRYLWDDKLDNFVSSTFAGDNFTATLMVGAVYFE